MGGGGGSPPFRRWVQPAECAQSQTAHCDTGTRDEACLLTRSKTCRGFEKFFQVFFFLVFFFFFLVFFFQKNIFFQFFLFFQFFFKKMFFKFFSFF